MRSSRDGVAVRPAEPPLPPDALAVEVEAANGLDERVACRDVDEGLGQQAIFDAEAFERATGRALNDGEREALIALNHQANRWTYLGSGLTHPRFLETLGKLSPAQRRRVEEVAPVFS